MQGIIDSTFNFKILVMWMIVMRRIMLLFYEWLMHMGAL